MKLEERLQAFFSILLTLLTSLVLLILIVYFGAYLPLEAFFNGF